MQLFNRLKALRLSKNLTQQRFAEIGNVSKRTYINYENGVSVPDSDFLKELYKEGFDVKYLITGDRDYSELNYKQVEFLDFYAGMPPEEREMIVEIMMLWHVFEPPEKLEPQRKKILNMLLKYGVLPHEEATMLRLYGDVSQEKKNFVLAELLRGGTPTGKTFNGDVQNVIEGDATFNDMKMK